MMWKSLDNVLFICGISLLVAALVTCSTELPDYDEVRFKLKVVINDLKSD